MRGAFLRSVFRRCPMRLLDLGILLSRYSRDQFLLRDKIQFIWTASRLSASNHDISGAPMGVLGGALRKQFSLGGWALDQIAQVIMGRENSPTRSLPVNKIADGLQLFHLYSKFGRTFRKAEVQRIAILKLSCCPRDKNTFYLEYVHTVYNEVRVDSSPGHFKSSSDDSSEGNCESQCSPASKSIHRERFYTILLPEICVSLSWCREETF